MHRKSAENVAVPRSIMAAFTSAEASMFRRVYCLLLLTALLAAPAVSKNKNKSALPEDILRAQTVRVVIDPDAGEPLDQPNANAVSGENVQKALRTWGRFQVLPRDCRRSYLS